MSARELVWRLGSAGRARWDGWLVGRRRERPSLSAVYEKRGPLVDSLNGHDIFALGGAATMVGDVPDDSRQAAITRAEEFREHRFSFFGFQRDPFGETIDWNREYNAGIDIPPTYAPGIDYRDYRVAGDCKYAWEPSRHQHLGALGRAYRHTGDVKYANEVVTQLRGWLDQCPFGMGMQWRSPLELGIRLINWAWAIELVRPAGVLADDFMERLLSSVYRHIWLIDRHYSRYSSANNHVIGEAAGVFIASLYFDGFKRARHWRERSGEILQRELILQSHGDGVTREQAVGYQFFVLEFFTLAGLAARRAGCDFPGPYWERLEQMYAFIAGLCEGGPAPCFGDADDGYVLDLGGGLNDAPSVMALGAGLFNRPDFAALGGNGFSERARWLLGPDVLRPSSDSLRASRLSPRAFPEGGYYILQSGRRGSADAISLVFDCGELGFGPIAAHGHADALSFVLRVAGLEIFVDPGTYDYFTYPAERTYFRSTAAHNTVMIDGQEQSESLGAFLWGRRVDVRCVRWDPEGLAVAGEIAGPPTHRREVRLDPDSAEVTIEDRVTPAASDVVARYHLHPDCQVALADDGLAARLSRDDVVLRFSVETVGESPVSRTARELSVEEGWFSTRYHRRRATNVLRVALPASGSANVARTRISLVKGIAVDTDESTAPARVARSI